jgi:hypothetical protein
LFFSLAFPPVKDNVGGARCFIQEIIPVTILEGTELFLAGVFLDG